MMAACALKGIQLRAGVIVEPPETDTVHNVHVRLFDSCPTCGGTMEHPPFRPGKP
jgi:hypothetical protein